MKNLSKLVLIVGLFGLFSVNLVGLDVLPKGAKLFEDRGTSFYHAGYRVGKDWVTLYDSNLGTKKELYNLNTKKRRKIEDLVSVRVSVGVFGNSDFIETGFYFIDIINNADLEDLKAAFQTQSNTEIKNYDFDQVEVPITKDDEPIKIINVQKLDVQPSRVGFYGRATLGAVAVAAISYGIYRVLKSQHKKRINRVIDNYDLKIDQFTGPQKDMMAAALNATYHVPTYMTKLKAMLIAGLIASESVDEQTMLKILASLYYKNDATDEDVTSFKEIVTPVVAESMES